MTLTARKRILLAEVVLLLVPLTLLMALLVPLTYVAYPIPDLQATLLAFDLGMLVKLLGILAAWRLAIGFLRFGIGGLRRAHLAWFVILLAAVAIGIASSVVAIEQNMFTSVYQTRVGFTLLAPALALAPLAAHLWWERRRGSE
ncbi:hypothetical protein [Billgrantia desiderata]|uniref:Uncharacterized protein n=1 Tax=Billgrantia desiderata TaxID=52021 RepID=A0AAW4YS07_9GAMM|nr:hypothetical protein [Halomonas desiderata]MCE8012833.1 hypothetical protein [Halomonas desiderata]MCE8027828.1 hypothetical protein [Halomonas desiderata]MCE8051383.1 hypothetical protein [Halomonas desiderata]SEF85729.1 hypothetical protein SAMN04487953_10754 [Halomonas desiderata]